MNKQLFRWALDAYKARKQAKHDASLPHVLATVRTLLDKAKYGFFISHGADGWCSTRYVQPICEWSGDVLSDAGLARIAAADLTALPVPARVKLLRRVRIRKLPWRLVTILLART